jgi:glycosyltransferase involved in cell wall biosynthesis
VISSADPRAGGPIEGISQRLNTLLGWGHTVEIATCDDPNSEFLKTFPVPVHALGPSISGFAFARGLRAWLNREIANYDVVIVNGLWQYHGVVARAAARRRGKDYWVFTHGMLDPWFNLAYPMKAKKKKLFWPLQHAVLRDAKAVLFTCEEERLLARQSFQPYEVRERVVSYGTSGPSNDSEAHRKAFIDAYPQLAGKKFLLFLSRVHPKKGVDLLLKSFEGMADGHPDIDLVIAGPVDSEYRAELESLVSDKKVAKRIHWAGMVQGDVKWGAFRSAEAFILPSHQENFGIAVVEALACGTPVLITNKVNIWREIEADGSGFVSDDTAAGVSQLLEKWRGTSPETRVAMGAAARGSFENRFTVEGSAKSLIEVVSE